MKNVFILLIGAAFSIVSCIPQSPIDQAEWILGTWEQNSSKGIVYETWTKKSEHELAGTSYRLNGNDTIVLETVRIVERGDSLFYIPTVTNQNAGKPTSFSMTKISDSEMVYENAAHDFPQVIAYRKVGSDSLVASISGTRDGKATERGFPMKKSRHDAYVCKPCNLSCDDLTFSEAGTCPHCGMELVAQRDLMLTEGRIKTGSGYFQVEGGVGKQDKKISVFYHKPKRFTADSRILIVVPGAGRNADSYRDAWIAESEKHNLLILSPMYPEREYAFEEYHLGGLLKRSNLEYAIEYVDNTNWVKLDEDRFQAEINLRSEEWIFNDFDRIFDLVVEALGYNQTTYDAFGHSAGGHILHRLAMFAPHSKANTIIAANASFYTMPSIEFDFPFGLQNAPVAPESLDTAFSRRFVLLLGELDNENESGGTFLRSKSADKQGLHRLARGMAFFEKAQKAADQYGFDFNWERVIVPNVGHDHRLMGDAAATYLYEQNE